MTETPKAKVGLLGLMFDLYDRIPEVKPMMARFGEELVEILSPCAVVDFPGVCNNREQVDRAVARFEAEGAESYSSSCS